jgi:uncharacterized protein YcnI
MTVRSRTLRRAVALAAVATLLVAAPASAHPFFRGGEAPVDSLATLTLDLAHGCQDEAAGEGDPTTDVAMEVPEWMRIVEVPEADGWQVELETDDDGRVEVVSWTDDGGAEPAPTFDLDVVVSGEAGDERFVRLFQACEGFEYRWIGTPDEPADDPAVRLRLVEADPDNPAPPEPEPEPEAGTDEEEDAATEDDATDATEDADATDDATGEDATEDDTTIEDAEVTDDEVDGDPLAADAADDGGLAWLWLVLAALVVVGLLVGLVRARRQGPGPTET